jgi:homogentisate 1,2-dioxygenase
MSGHGPDGDTFAKAAVADTSRGTRIADTMAFMFETRRVIQPTRFALESEQLQGDYYRCWESLPKSFDPERR